MNRQIVSLAEGRKWEIYVGGDGAPLLWLHGLRGVDLDDPILKAMQKDYRVIAPVAPGFNDLDELAKIDNIHELVLDYDSLVRSCGLRDFTVIGHSFGAMIAADLVAHFPTGVSKLALLAPFGLWNDAHPVADIFATPYTQMDDILWHNPNARERFARKPTDDGDIKAAAEQAVRLAQSLAAVTKFVWPIPDRGLRRRLSRITCPTLAMFGAQDKVVSPRYADDFQRGIADCRTEVVADGGHMFAYENPLVVLEHLNTFLSAAKSR